MYIYTYATLRCISVYFMVQCGPLVFSYSGIDRKLFVNPIRFDVDILQSVELHK